MSKSWKVFLATAIGALIGGIVGESVISWLWWVGMIVGGFVGHFVYDWKRVVSAAGNAWRAAWRELPKRTRSILSWRPHKNAKWDWLALQSLWFSIFSWAVLGVFVMVGGVAFSNGDRVKPDEMGIVVLAALGIYASFFFLICLTIFKTPTQHMSREDLQDVVRIFLKLSPFYSVPWLLIWTPVQIVKTLVKVVCAIPMLARFIKTFTVKLFLGIHSEERLICGVDAALGALIVHLAGGSLLALVIGTIAGGLIGVVNYEIITLRWLVPKGYVTLKD